jgi:acetyl esterase/lipase
MNTVPAEMAAQLRALGHDCSALDVAALYAPLTAAAPREGVQCATNQAYGEHARQRLDVYVPLSTGERAHPVLVMLHGGGFVRGDKSQRVNVGFWGAREGFVTVVANYRLAPDNRWPSGPEDVVAIWRWVHWNITRFSGDPARVVLMGESAGATHVAGACLDRTFQPDDWRIAGAVLLSGPYNPRLEGLARAQFGIATPDPRNEPYFGSDPQRWREASVVDRVDADPFPLLIAYAERDLLQMQVQAGELFARLVGGDGFAPSLHCWREHNHFSPGFSFGTDDTSVSSVVAAFIARHTAARAGW